MSADRSGAAGIRVQTTLHPLGWFRFPCHPEQRGKDRETQTKGRRATDRGDESGEVLGAVRKNSSPITLPINELVCTASPNRETVSGPSMRYPGT